MPNNSDSSNGKKALGQDPFADINVSTWEMAESTSEPEDASAPVATEEETSEPIVDETPPKPEIEVFGKPAKPEQQSPKVEPANETSHYLDDLITDIDARMQHSPFVEALRVQDDTALPTVNDASLVQYVIFTLFDTEYAIPIDNVLEISRPPAITPVPNLPNWLLGVVNLRGDILSTVDLRSFLSLPKPTFGDVTRMIVAQTTDTKASLTVGLMVDRVNEIRYLPKTQLSAPSTPIAEQVAPYMQGVYVHKDRLLVVLNLNKLLNSPEMRQFEPI